MRRLDWIDLLLIAAMTVVVSALVAIGHHAFEQDLEMGLIFICAVLFGIAVSGR